MTKFHTQFRRYFYVDVESEGEPTDGLTAEDVAYDAAYKKIADTKFWIQSDRDSVLAIDGPYVDENYEPETSEVEE